jgi:endo-1,4-beta-mannosidase
MSSFLKSLDPNHLVGIGDEGYFNRSFAFGNAAYNGSFGVDCERLLSIPGIDFGTCHLYPSFAVSEDPVEFGTHWIRDHIEAAQRANKPMVIEEYGWEVEAGNTAQTTAPRDAAFQTWLAEVQAHNGAGALLWMIASVTPDGQRYPDYDHYTVYDAQDVPSVLAYARAVKAASESPSA